jgi:hypothetical protein
MSRWEIVASNRVVRKIYLNETTIRVDLNHV